MIARTFDILSRYRDLHILPDALAGVQNGTWVKYSGEEYLRMVHLCSCGFLSLGLQPGDRIITVSNNRPEWNFVDMGMAQAGIIHVPLYATISQEEYRFIFEQVEPSLLIVSDKILFEKLTPLAHETASLKGFFTFNQIEGAPHWSKLTQWGEEAGHEIREQLEQIKNSIQTDDVVSIIYTSGTTGVPKGVMLTHGNFVSNCLVTAEVHTMGYGSRALSFLPICHVYERLLNYHYQYKGVSIYYAENHGKLFENIREVKPHLFVTVPRVLERLYAAIVKKSKDLNPVARFVFQQALNFGLSYEPTFHPSLLTRIRLHIARKLVFRKWIEALGGNVRIVVSGGAAVQTRLIRVFSAAGILMLEGYGLTETSPVISVSNPVRKLLKAGTVGPILDGVEVAFAPDGEILVKGPNVMKGYYKSPDLTREVIDEQGFFHTGDVGLLEDGIFLKITDRKKEIFKLSNGKYIAPQPLENKLREFFFVEQAMIVGEGEKFASALIAPNFTYLHDFCRKAHIDCGGQVEMIRHPAVISHVQKGITSLNKTLGSNEQIKRFRLVSDEWSVDGGELSPTMKLRRHKILQKYAPLIDEIYSPSRRNGISDNDE